MMPRTPSVLLIAPLLASCGGERPTADEFMPVAREVLEFAEADARRNQPGRASDGPLYVSVRSFQQAAERATRTSIPLDSMERVLGDPVPAELEQILLCDTIGNFGGCWVRQFGVFVNLNMVQVAGNEMSLFVRTSATDRSVRPTDFCHRVWRVDYRKEDAGWRLAERRVLRDCTDGR
jgi:hypothetical protein